MTRESAFDQAFVRTCVEGDPEDIFLRMSVGLRSVLYAVTLIRRQMLRADAAPKDLRYSCTEELVLFNGHPKATRVLDGQIPDMTPGNCFGNAFEITQSYPGLRYVEGWAVMEQGTPTHHAWIEHADGSISDPTWAPIIRATLARPDVQLNPNYAARGIYMGVSVDRDAHLGWFAEHNTMNLLSFGDMMPVDILRRGLDVIGDYALAESDIESTREGALDYVRSNAKWRLDAEGTGFIREHPDGRVDRWRGETML